MPNKAAELGVVNNSLLDQETITEIAGVLKIIQSMPKVADSFSKFKKLFSKGGGSKRDLKKLGTEIDDLKKAFETLCGLMSQHVASNGRLSEAILGLQPLFTQEKFAALSSWASGVNVGVKSIAMLTPVVLGHTTIVLGHERRLATLEASISKAKSTKGGRVGKMSAVGQSVPPLVEMKGFKVYHLEGGQRAAQ